MMTKPTNLENVVQNFLDATRGTTDPLLIEWQQRMFTAMLHSEAAEYQRVLESIANYAWRDSLTDAERLSVIKHHPTIKRIWGAE